MTASLVGKPSSPTFSPKRISSGNSPQTPGFVPHERNDGNAVESSIAEGTRKSCGEATPEERIQYGYEDPQIELPKIRKFPKQSAMKRGTTHRRRASIQMGQEIEVYLPGNMEPVRRGTCITFNNEVRVKKVAPISDLKTPPEELWFQSHEYEQMKRKSWMIVDQVENGDIGHAKFCTRGLERMMRSSYVRQKRFLVWDSVMEEQDAQREQGFFDETYLADIYRYTSAVCQEEALQRGQNDAIEIEAYMRSTRDFCRRSSV